MSAVLHNLSKSLYTTQTDIPAYFLAQMLLMPLADLVPTWHSWPVNDTSDHGAFKHLECMTATVFLTSKWGTISISDIGAMVPAKALRNVLFLSWFSFHLGCG